MQIGSSGGGKMNNSKVKVPMKEQDPIQRSTNFEEVTYGYTLVEAMEEAARCLDCKTKPCVEGCPVNVPIPGFISALKDGDVEMAYKVLTLENRLPAICGRVCPQEKQCESKCVRGIKGEAVAIGYMERFVADYYMENYKDKPMEIEKNGMKIAIVGSGPAGITCAAELAVKGYDVTLFEALHELGGVLVYGIPEFRLPKKLVKDEINRILKLGVRVNKNVIVGKSITIEDLVEEGYEAIFIGSGAGLPKFLNIPGENYNGVYASNEFLTRVNLMKAYKYPEVPTPVNIGKSVAVVGAGNVAMDCARVAKRLGAEKVSIIYRRSEEEMPARLEEIHHAKEEGIQLELLTNPVKIIGEDNKVTGILCHRMELGEPDNSGRRRPVPIDGSDVEISVETVIIAVGQSPNPLIKDSTDSINFAHWGGIVVDEMTMETSMPGVYAGGDAVTGAATVILAMGAGKKAAEAIDFKLKQLAITIDKNMSFVYEV